jgi:hypothetical protein
LDLDAFFIQAKIGLVGLEISEAVEMTNQDSQEGNQAPAFDVTKEGGHSPATHIIHIRTID